MPLTTKQIALIETWRMGFIATVSAEGRPNVSPKGTFVVLDEAMIAFGEMRSPNTLANIAHQAEVEVNFIDVLSRAGLRIRGAAQVVERGAAFDALLPAFRPHWDDDLLAMFNVIVTIACDELRPVRSPAYETGATEAELRTLWKSKIAEMPV